MPDWIPATLGDCFDFVSTKVDPATVDDRRPYVGMEHLDAGSPHVSRSASPKGVASTVSVFESGDVLFGRLRPYLRKAAVASTAGVCSPEILVLRPKQLVSEWFLYLLVTSNEFIQFAVDRSAGSRMPRVSATDLASFPVMLPPPHERTRIASALGAVDEQIDTLVREAAAAESLRLQVARSAVERVAKTRIGDIATVSQGKSLPKESQGKRTGPVSWFKIADMTAPSNTEGYAEAGTQLSEGELRALRGVVLPVGAVVFPRVGAAVLTEKKRIMDVEGAVDENHIALCAHDPASAELLLATMQNLRLADHVQAGAVPSLNMALVRALLTDVWVSFGLGGRVGGRRG